jgi:glutathionylspermidine synthase
MIRKRIDKRPDWQQKFEEAGFAFHSLDGQYWLEGVCYEFSEEQVDYLEDVTRELSGMCRTAVDHVIRRGRWDELGIPEEWRDLVAESWQRRDSSLYGRFDLAYDGVNPARLLEYNADTPTSLYESSVAQWLWLEEALPGMDQFNSIHEKLLDVFTRLRQVSADEVIFHFTAITDHQEDFITTEYLRDVATQAGFSTTFIFIDELGYDESARRFVDRDLQEIQLLFKLYPWEWLLSDDFGQHLRHRPIGRIYEPAWKLILASKGILPILWELYPNHPNLLAASFKPLPGGGRMARKPLFSREGANIQILDGEHVVETTEGPYTLDRGIYQEYCQLPRFDDAYALVGSWVIGNTPAGIGIREDSSVITRNTSKFVPHYFVPLPK